MGILEQAEIEFNQLLTSLLAKGFKVKVKSGWKWKLLHYLTIIFTFGGNRRFLSSYSTTIGKTIGLAQNFYTEKTALQRLVVLRHEVVHLKQFAKYGVVVTSLLYLLCLPTIVAYGRYKLEREAYLESMVCLNQYFGFVPSINFWSYVNALSGPNYGYAWVFRKQVENYFRTQLSQLKIEVK